MSVMPKAILGIYDHYSSMPVVAFLT